ncbi:Alpha/Beta hydrolase protein [Xylariaceae sp. FL1651]|nr:Alpha/Beta hydrolase protein [Xylariaceae sp. FL1651]
MAIGTQLNALLAAWAMGASALPSHSTNIRDINTSIPSALSSSKLYGAPDNDFACKSSRNPVVVLHGLSADRNVDLNLLQYELNGRGYCTFSQTYGAYAVPDWIGGLRDMTQSAQDIAAFVREVQDKTGAAKVDIVGHSEGGVQAIYVPLTQAGVAGIVEHLVALGPAIHGARYFGFTDLWYIGGEATRALVGALIDLVGCPACEQLAPDGKVTDDFAKAPKIAQEGNKITVIMSKSDTLVTPDVSTIDEPEVNNVFVQTTCPDDKVGHAGLAWDKSVWRLIINALEETEEEVYPCEQGLPF